MNDFDRDIITALRYQVMHQNKRIMELEAFLRGLEKRTPHQWLRDDIREILSE